MVIQVFTKNKNIHPVPSWLEKKKTRKEKYNYLNNWKSKIKSINNY